MSREKRGEEASKGELADAVESLLEDAPASISEIVKEALTSETWKHVISAVPHISGVVLSYRLKRSERNFLRMFAEMRSRQVALEQAIARLSAAQIAAVKEGMFPAMCDFVAEEAEEGKVAFYVQGFVGVAGAARDGMTDEYAMLAEVLSHLRAIEVVVLADWVHCRSDMITMGGHAKYLSERGLTESNFGFVNTKLRSLGLITNTNETRVRKVVEELSKGNLRPINTAFMSGESLASTEAGRMVIRFCEGRMIAGDEAAGGS